MPASKRQKTSSDSSVSAQRNDSHSPTPQGSDESRSDASEKRDNAPYAYHCMPRPFFDVKNENWARGENRLSSPDCYEEIYAKGFDEAKARGIFGKPAVEYKDWKWVIMNDASEKSDYWRRKALYCDPDMFGMHIYTDWKGWGLQELVENVIVEFDKGFRKAGGEGVDEMWAVMSALGFSLNANDLEGFINCDDGPKACELTGLIGYALLTTLNSIEQAGELKPDSKYMDLPLVIGYFLEWSHDLPGYGIEGNAVSWRNDAVAYFKDANLDPKRGTFNTERLLDKLEGALNYDMIGEECNSVMRAPDLVGEHDPPKGTEEDPWGWDERIKKYRRKHEKMGGTHYDITKFTRAQRKYHVLGKRKKDPLADFSVEDLKDDMVDFD